MQTLTPQSSRVDQVYEAILADITAGKFGADGRLIQEEIADALGVSRQPVQQALLLLRSQGLLRDAPGRGLMLAPLDPQYVRELYELRAVLDGLASAKAAERANKMAKECGPALVARGRAAVKSRSIGRMIEADMAFHFFLYELSGNALVAEVSGPHWSYLRRVMGEVLLRGETPGEIWEQHQMILDAVAAGDSAAAERVAREHISMASDTLTTAMAKQHQDDASPNTSQPSITTKAPSGRKKSTR